MDLSHYLGIYPAYVVAILGWVLINKQWKLSDETEEYQFEKPWKEFLLALLATGLTISIGQLYIADLLLPKFEGWSFLTEALNHSMIFAPFLILLIVRLQPFQTAWIPKGNIWQSLLIGLGLAILAIFAFELTKGRMSNFLPALKGIYTYKNLHLMTQVFWEDFAIAVCFVRFSAMIGKKPAIAVVAILFAAGHIPAMLNSEVFLNDFIGLMLDAGLGVLVLSVLSKSRNILWFWMVHFAMDMMQFVG